jgi:hypothetical protein
MNNQNNKNDQNKKLSEIGHRLFRTISQNNLMSSEEVQRKLIESLNSDDNFNRLVSKINIELDYAIKSKNAYFYIRKSSNDIFNWRVRTLLQEKGYRVIDDVIYEDPYYEKDLKVLKVFIV